MTTSPRRRAAHVIAPTTMRDHDVHDRPATPLELLFDLCFVVAVAVLAAELDHGVVDGHALEAAAKYALLTLLQMGGVLAVAATIPTAWQGEPLPFALAYAAMRIPLVAQWIRAARADAAHRGFLTYAGGSVLAQVLWVVGATLPTAAAANLFVLALATELTTPVLAVSRSPDRVFHPGHIAERYGLFTIIVLGETILAISVGLRDALDGEGELGSAPLVVAAALVIAFGLWWIYFDALDRDALTRNRKAAFQWGYGHYVLFAAVAATGAGVQAQLHLAHDDQGGGHLVPIAAVAVPVAISLAAIAWLQQAARGRAGDAVWLYLGAALAFVTVPVSGALSVAGADALLAVLIATLVLRELLSRRTAHRVARPTGCRRTRRCPGNESPGTAGPGPRCSPVAVHGTTQKVAQQPPLVDYRRPWTNDGRVAHW